MIKQQLLLALLLIGTKLNYAFAQDSLITKVAQESHSLFRLEQTTFNGAAWDTITSKAQKSQFVLIGEAHFTNEIPLFCDALTSKVKFDNLFCEIDPYSSQIIQSKIQTLNDDQLRKYQLEFGNTFSFYSLSPEFSLIKKLVKSGTNILGIDQILMVADRLICSDIKLKTKNQLAKKIYQKIEDKSKEWFAKFLENQSNPIYLLTEDFNKNLEQLASFKLSNYEMEIIDKWKLTSKIYQEQSHHLRVQLMKNQLMKNYAQWGHKKNLFKFGAVHLPKGESLLKIYDIGNLINNLADSKFNASLHIMVVGKSGTQGSPFKNFPEEKVNASSENLKALKPFFGIVVDQNSWYCIDMLPIRKKLDKGEIQSNDKELSRIIRGYDYVVIIPTVSAAKFPN
jgi:hypothetical protein